MRGKKPCHQCGTLIGLASRSCSNCNADLPRACHAATNQQTLGSPLRLSRLINFTNFGHGRQPQRRSAIGQQRNRAQAGRTVQHTQDASRGISESSDHRDHMECDQVSDHDQDFGSASPIAPRLLNLHPSDVLESYVAQLRMIPGRCTIIVENSRDALCFAVAGHTAVGGIGVGIAVSSVNQLLRASSTRSHGC